MRRAWMEADTLPRNERFDRCDAPITEEQRKVIDARIVAHRDRVSAELDRMGRAQGTALKVCACGAETVRTPGDCPKFGWVFVNGAWLCPICNGSDYIPRDLGSTESRNLRKYQPMLDLLDNGTELSHAAIIRHMGRLHNWGKIRTGDVLTKLRDLGLLEYSRDGDCWRKKEQ